MSLSIITFADFGRKKNQKTADILPVVEKFIEEKELDQLICRINRGFHFEKTYSAINVFLHYILKGIEEFLIPSFFSRKYEEKIFDFFASKKLKKSDLALFHPARFDKTLEKAKKNGSIVVSIAVEAHSSYISDLIDNEAELLGLNNVSRSKRNLSSDFTGKSDYIIALSDFVKNTYIKYGFPEEKIFIAYPDVNISKKELEVRKDDKFRILFVADISLLKGLHYLLDAWEEMDLEESELLIAGKFKKSELPPELFREYMKRIKSDSRIRYLGYCKNIENIYNYSSVFVFPSLTEGFGKATLEAMLSGLPVITTQNAKGIVENGETGFIIPIRDKEAIKEKIEFFYNNREKIKYMGEKAEERALNKAKFGEKVFNICEEILNRNI